MSNISTEKPGTATSVPSAMNPAHPTPSASRSRTRRLSTETKPAFKTTELMAYLGSVVAILIAAQMIGDDSSAGKGGDYFRADRAFLYITIVTVGYLLSRGLAKSGSRDFYDDEQ
jgi:hypothetical protein